MCPTACSLIFFKAADVRQAACPKTQTYGPPPLLVLGCNRDGTMHHVCKRVEEGSVVVLAPHTERTQGSVFVCGQTLRRIILTCWLLGTRTDSSIMRCKLKGSFFSACERSSGVLCTTMYLCVGRTPSLNAGGKAKAGRWSPPPPPPPPVVCAVVVLSCVCRTQTTQKNYYIYESFNRLLFYCSAMLYI